MDILQKQTNNNYIIETGYCHPNHAIKTTVNWEPKVDCRIFASFDQTPE